MNTVKVRDICIGEGYSYQNKAMGILIEKYIQGAGGAGYQEPYYKLKFQQKDSKIEIILDWDEKLIPIKNG